MSYFHRILGILMLSGCFFSLLAQEKPYFQQRVNYQIKVRLDEERHQLQGLCTWVYENHAPDTLRELYVHLWPNAYRGGHTALGRQMRRQARLDFVFQPDAERGFMDSLAFQTAGRPLAWSQQPQNPDIALIRLAQPLAPNQVVEITTPFRVQIPVLKSRLGRTEEAYFLTQWYPKPAVYDAGGWQALPYLESGEFYSEFGRFEVELEVPAHYRLIATGMADEPSQKILNLWSDSSWAYVGRQGPNPPYLTPPIQKLKETLVLRFVADKVHDFAWFASPSYLLLRDRVNVQGREDALDLYRFFPPDQLPFWLKADSLMQRALAFYGGILGPYPYGQASAVFSPDKGGGMEYPMLSLVGWSEALQDFDNILAHELGHTWFYGVLANNERAYAWLDEGFNTYVENRYMAKYYPETLEGRHLRASLGHAYYHALGLAQAIETPSEDFAEGQYGLSVYLRAAQALEALERDLGLPLMDSLLRVYYDTWAFKHPSPDAVRKLFEAGSGRDLTWFFEDWIRGTAVSAYRLEASAGGLLRLSNAGDLAPPFTLALLDSSGQVLDWRSLSGFKGLAVYDVDTLFGAEVLAMGVSVQLDYWEVLPQLITEQILPLSGGRALRGPVWFFPNFKALHRPQYLFFPLLAWNPNNGLLLGLGHFRLPFPFPRWHHYLNLFWSSKPRTWAGTMGLQHHRAYERGALRSWTLGLALRRFHFNSVADSLTEVSPWYGVLRAFTEWHWGQAREGGLEQRLSLEVLGIREARALFVNRALNGLLRSSRGLYRLGYRAEHKDLPRTQHFWADLEYSDGGGLARGKYLKLALDWRGKSVYNARGEAWFWRLYLGGFLWHGDRSFGAYPLHLARRNWTDYHYDDWFLGRARQEGIFRQQLVLGEGGFKLPLLNALDDGRSNAFLGALNLKGDLPNLMPKGLALRPFLDLAYSVNTAPSIVLGDWRERFYASSGLGLELADGAIGLYFVAWNSPNLRLAYRSLGAWYERLAVVLDLGRIRPLERAKRLESLLGAF